MLLLPLLLGACQTVLEEPTTSVVDEVAPGGVVAPMVVASIGGDPGQRPLQEFYVGLLRRLEQAARERDPVTVDALVDSYERMRLPAHMRDCLATYRAISRGLWYQRQAAAIASLQFSGQEAAAEPPSLGEQVLLEFQLPAADLPVWLAGRREEEPVGFAVVVVVDDTYVDGSERRTESLGRVFVDRSQELRGKAKLRLPIALDLQADAAVERRVQVRIEWLPGHLVVDGLRAPIRSEVVARMDFLQRPAGYAALQAQPLLTLQEALRRGDPAHFPHVFLAARCLPALEREAAIELLVDWIRFGNEAQVRVGTAALRAVTGRNLAVGDREAWLRWWQHQR